ncbi:TonB-dependent receptor [Roseimicrobium sp. ORNL1]|uniref:TonB-dependent siderophore receptor n=1 Tax=Roseimicrobium sp. ORNL1 TaxID=2711231 RepID=UPI0013E15722|nr:TonB-dependent receptor [Roseimicrobium sp. ORNL1]QIF03826.1 TonB-dependent receptor [Roseimicrobium sp. ORNL1]
MSLHSVSRLHRYRVLLTTLLFSLVAAVGTHAQEQKTFAFAQGSMSLGDALEGFSLTTNLDIAASTDVVAGKTAPAVKGNFTAREALERILSGSGLSYRHTDARTIAIIGSNAISTAGGDGPNAELPPVVVTAESVTGYTAPDSTSATKTNLPAFESPFSIQAVPRAVVEDQKSTRLEDALRNVSAVGKSGSDYNGLYDVFTIRGMPLTNYGLIYRDGFRQRVPQVNLDNIETVEVLKGASGGLFGRIEPGGLINLVTKKPLDEAHYSLEQQVGSYSLTHTLGDATGPLNEENTLRYRMIAGYEEGDSFREGGEYSRLLLSPSLSWDITPQTQFNINFEYKKSEDILDGGHVAKGDRPVDIPAERFLGVRDVPSSPSEYWLVNASITHEFNDQWKAKLRGVWWNWRADYFEVGPNDGVNPDGRTVDLYHFTSQEEDTTWFAELSLEGKFDTGALKHDVLLSAEYYSFESEQLNYFVTAPDVPLRPLDVFRPQYQNYSILPPHRPQDASKPKDEWWGFTLQDVVTIDERLKILAGIRYDITSASTYYDGDVSTNTNAIDRQFQDEGRFTPRVGFNYELLPWLSVFGSYSESFSDSTFGLLADGSTTEPQSATQYEGGVKGRWLDGRLNATLALFHLTKENLTTDLPNSFFVTQSGEARSRGVELDVSGYLTERLSLIASYAYLDTEITKDPVNQGNRLPNAPEHSGSLWARYDFPSGFTIGAGLTAVGDRAGDLDNTFVLESYIRADVMAAYRFKVGNAKMTAQFNINNLFNEDYYDGSGGSSRTYIYSGEPRTFIGSLRIEF